MTCVGEYLIMVLAFDGMCVEECLVMVVAYDDMCGECLIMMVAYDGMYVWPVPDHGGGI